MEATKDEMESMMRNKIWELVDLPPQHRSIGNKWIFKIKHRANVSITSLRYVQWRNSLPKLRGEDCEETFSLVIRITSIRLFLTLIVHLDLELFQMNVKTTSLNKNLKKEIFMDQLIGFVSKGQENKVCRLRRSICGLKHSSRV